MGGWEKGGVRVGGEEGVRGGRGCREQGKGMGYREGDGSYLIPLHIHAMCPSRRGNPVHVTH